MSSPSLLSLTKGAKKEQARESNSLELRNSPSEKINFVSW